MKIQTLFIKFHFFTFKFRFFPTALINQQILLKGNLSRYYECVDKAKGKEDISIDVVDNAAFGLFSKKEKGGMRYYEEFASLKKNNVTITYSTSLTQLSHLLHHQLLQLCHTKMLIPLHASSVRIGSDLFVFIGDSGNGKSTIAHMIQGLGTQFSDELVYIFPKNKQLWGYPNFFMEKNILLQSPKSSTGYRIKHIFNLEKSGSEKLVDQEKKYFFSHHVLPQLLLPSGSKNRPRLVASLLNSLDSVQMSTIHFSLNKKRLEEFFYSSLIKPIT